MRRRVYRVTFSVVVLLAWLFATGLAAEVFARWRSRVDEYRAESLRGRVQALVGRKEQETVSEFARRPVKTGTDIEARQSFGKLGREERAEFAIGRREVVVICSPSGEIRERYLPETPAAIVEIGRGLHEGGKLMSMLPEKEAQDAAAALAQAGSGGGFQLREYEVQVSSNPRYVAQFAFQPFNESGPEPQGIGIFIRESMWEKLWVSFRPNVYQNDAYEFRTNNVGYRDDDVTLPKPAGVFRILCIGASTTAEGPTNELTYPNLLEKKLVRRFGEGRIEVVNCGVFAITSAIERDKMPEYLALAPDMIVHYNFVNDVVVGMRDRLQAARTWQNPVEMVKGWLLHSRFLYRYANWFLQPRRAIKDYVSAVTVANVGSMSRMAREAGTEFVVCSFARPRLEQLDTEHRAFFESCIDTMLWGRTMSFAAYARIVDFYNAAIRDLCEDEQIPYVPVAESMIGGAECFTDICHMNLVAMEMKAEIVFRHIERLVAQRMDGQSRESE